MSFWASSFIIFNFIFIILNSNHCWEVISDEDDFDLKSSWDSWDLKLSSCSYWKRFIAIIFDDSVDILNRDLSLLNLLIDLFVDVSDSDSDWVLAHCFLAVKNDILKRSFSSSAVNSSCFWSLHDIQHFCVLNVGCFECWNFVLSAAHFLTC